MKIRTVKQTQQLYKGYSLHHARLSFTGKESIRTIKYPIVFDVEYVDYEKDLADKMHREYTRLYGPLDVVSFTQMKGVKTLVEFYKDLLRAGFIFGESSTELESYFTSDEFECGPELHPLINHEVFLDEVIKKPWRFGSVKDLSKKISKLFLKDIQENTKVKILIKEIVDTLPDGAVQQAHYWKERFGVIVRYSTVSENSEKQEKFVCAPNPSLPLSQDLNLLELIERIGNTSEERERKSGLSGNFNSFSWSFNSFFRILLEKDTIDIVRMFMDKFPHLWKESNKDDLEKRVAFVSISAKALGKPELVSSWADYRSVFGGRLKSWNSNSLNYKEKIKEQLSAHKDDIENLSSFMLSLTDDEQLSKKALSVQEYLVTLENMRIKILEDTKEGMEIIPLYRDTLSEIKQISNSVYQQFQEVEMVNNDSAQKDQKKKKKNTKEEVETIDKKYKKLFGTLQQMPEEFGESKRMSIEKYYKSPENILRNMFLVESLLKQIKTNEIIEKISLLRNEHGNIFEYSEKIRKIASQARSKKIRTLFREALKSYIGEVPEGLYNPDQKKSITVYFKNSRSRDRRLVVKEISSQQAKDLVVWFVNVSFFESTKKLLVEGAFDELLDIIEITKLQVSIACRISPNVLDISNVNLERGHYGYAYRAFKGDTLQGEDRNTFIQRGILSDLRGHISLISKTEFLVRSVLQPLGNATFFNLTYVPKEGELSTDPYIQRTTPHHWKFIFTDKHTKDHKGKQEFIIVDKKSLLPAKKKEFDAFAKIQSSRHQMRFLEDYLFPMFCDKKVQDMKVSLSEPTLILEQKVKRIIFEKEEKIEIKVLTETENNFFVSLPFNLVPIKQGKFSLKENRYIGIDVGEYGLAYSVLDFGSNDMIKIHDTGFLYDPSLRAIRDHFNRYKRRSRAGTFSRVNSSLMGVRDSAIGGLKNKIHDLVIQYQAKPIYEFSISNFETGNGKVTKIYNSVKEADVEGDSNSSKLTWGSSGKISARFGSHISARYTSQTCVKCGRCAPEELPDVSKINYARVLDKDILRWDDVSLSFPASSKEKYEDKVKDTLRPSVTVCNISDDEKNIIRKKRGNSCYFICPFDGCHHQADADIQASCNIAIRGYAHDKTKEKEENRERKDIEREIRNKNLGTLEEVTKEFVV